MARHVWRTLGNGQVEVNGEVWLLSPSEHQVFSRNVVDRWATIIYYESVRTAVPAAWIMGMVWAESAGNPKARSKDGGYGLLQLTSKAAKGNLTEEDLLDGEKNLAQGSDFLARLRRDHDLVSTTSLFNAGGLVTGEPHPSERSPWGFRETSGHIERVVRASNSAIACLDSWVFLPEQTIMGSLTPEEKTPVPNYDSIPPEEGE